MRQIIDIRMLLIFCIGLIWGLGLAFKAGKSQCRESMQPWTTRIWNISYKDVPREGDVWLGWDEPRDSAVTSVKVFQNGDWNLVWERDERAVQED